MWILFFHWSNNLKEKDLIQASVPQILQGSFEANTYALMLRSGTGSTESTQQQGHAFLVLNMKEAYFTNCHLRLMRFDLIWQLQQILEKAMLANYGFNHSNRLATTGCQGKIVYFPTDCKCLLKIGHKEGATPQISLLWLWSQTDAKPWSPEAYVKVRPLELKRKVRSLITY